MASTVRETEGKPAPGAKESARVQVTTPRAASHVQPSPLPDTYASPAGRVSVTVLAPWATPPPVLRTPMV